MFLAVILEKFQEVFVWNFFENALQLGKTARESDLNTFIKRVEKASFYIPFHWADSCSIKIVAFFLLLAFFHSHDRDVMFEGSDDFMTKLNGGSKNTSHELVGGMSLF